MLRIVLPASGRWRLVSSAAAIFFVSATLAVAADPALGKAKAAAVCVVCHGALGQAMQPNVPNLAGQSELYTEEQLRNYRSGKRTHEVMSLMAKPLTDREIENLAAWYASLKVEVQEK